jgi:hypothetical protein
VLTHQGGHAPATAMKCRMMTVGNLGWRVGSIDPSGVGCPSRIGDKVWVADDGIRPPDP